jgi:DNA-binding SARP family transcriptional activator
MRAACDPPVPAPVDVGTVVHLVGGPFVTVDGRRHEVPEGSKRLLAFVALRRGRVERLHAAGVLWPDGGDGRAAGNLRSALWRLRGAGIEALVADKWTLALRDDVVVDVHRIAEWANRLIAGRPDPGDLALSRLAPEYLDLLPGWYDDWAIADRERLRQRMLHAIEALSRELTAVGRHADAIEAAMLAIHADPLRESAQRVLVEAHLAEGNWAQARHAVLSFRSVIVHELGVEPSPTLTALLHRAPPRAAVGARG